MIGVILNTLSVKYLSLSQEYMILDTASMEAVISKNIDIDKYADRFGDNFPNDKRQFKREDITFMSCHLFQTPRLFHYFDKDLDVLYIHHMTQLPIFFLPLSLSDCGNFFFKCLSQFLTDNAKEGEEITLNLEGVFQARAAVEKRSRSMW